MPYPKPFFPTSIWDGLTANVDRVTVHSNVNPNAEDWERVAAEVISLEEQVSGGATAVPPTTITTSVTLDVDSGSVQLADATLGNIVVTLGSAADLEGKQFTIKKTDSSGSSITIDPSGSETIDGSLTQVISTQYVSITIVSDGTEWFIL